MPDVSLTNLVVLCAVGAAAPWLLGFAPRLRLPSVVLEIVAGVVLGPSALGWVRVDLPGHVLSLIGLTFLLFLSGRDQPDAAARPAAARHRVGLPGGTIWPEVAV